MIFVTVGTQLSFDRLVKQAENWALENNYTDIVFQVGSQGYKPLTGRSFEFISGKEADNYFNEASVVIGHAGMGTILSCLSEGKPLVFMPRLYTLNEHRNDHQLATYTKLKYLDGLFPADDELMLNNAINDALKSNSKSHAFNSRAPVEITDYIKSRIYSF